MKWMWIPNPSQLMEPSSISELTDVDKQEDQFTLEKSYDHIWLISEPESLWKSFMHLSDTSFQDSALIFTTRYLIPFTFISFVILVLFKASNGISNIRSSQEEKRLKENVRMKFEPLRTEEDELGTFD